MTFLALRELFAVVPMSFPMFIAESVPVFASAESALGGCFANTSGDVSFPSVATAPLYSFELDTPREHTRTATDGDSNDTLTMKGFNYDETQ